VRSFDLGLHGSTEFNPLETVDGPAPYRLLAVADRVAD
jgi:hypothetical protein